MPESPNTPKAFSIRKAEIRDVKTVLSYVRKKAAFDSAVDGTNREVRATESSLAERLFGEVRYAHALIAAEELGDAGFALFYYRFSSFAGAPSIWIDDLFVDVEHRSRGIGLELIKRLLEELENIRGTHLGWTASAKNMRGLNFYRSLGSRIVQSQENVATLRLDPADFLARASKSRSE